MIDGLREKIEAAARKYGLTPAVVYGVCVQESGLDAAAVRYEPNYRWLVRCPDLKPGNCSVLTEETLQKMSIGIMQVMGAVYREQGYPGWLPRVFGDVETQLDAGCRHLAAGIKRWGGIDDGIAAYNAGSPRRKQDGTYENQAYVDGVLRYGKEW